MASRFPARSITHLVSRRGRWREPRWKGSSEATWARGGKRRAPTPSCKRYGDSNGPRIFRPCSTDWRSPDFLLDRRCIQGTRDARREGRLHPAQSRQASTAAKALRCRWSRVLLAENVLSGRRAAAVVYRDKPRQDRRGITGWNDDE